MIQIRNVPDDVHGERKARADEAPSVGDSRRSDPGGTRHPLIVADASVVVDLLLGAGSKAGDDLYDGIYLALAEALDVPLVTGDAALRGVPGCVAAVQIVATSNS